MSEQDQGAPSGISPGNSINPADGHHKAKRRHRYAFQELVHLPRLQELTDALYRTTGIHSSVVSTTGELLIRSGWQSICTDFHRKHPQSEKACIESDLRIIKDLGEGAPIIYKCPRGLMNAAVPILIDDEHVANVYAGQLFTEPPIREREEFFRRQAREFGYDEESYMEAYWKIPVFTQEKFQSAVAFLVKFAQMIADIGIARQRELDALQGFRLNEQIIAGIEEGMVVYGPDLHYRAWNPFMERLTGRRAEDVLGRHPLAVFPFLREMGLIDHLERALAGETFSQLEFPYRRDNGKVRWMSDTIIPLRGAEDRIGGVIGIVHDVTERKRIEQELRETEERFRLAFYTSPDSVNINRLEDGLYVDINEGFTRVTGFTREEVIGKTSLDINIWADPMDRAKLAQGLREKGFYENLEANFRKKDGSMITALMSAKIILLDGIPHILSITRDISDIKRLEGERRSLEERLQRAEKMEALGTLAGGVAHDLNNVLGIVVGYAEMLSDEIDETSPARSHSQKILESGVRAAAIVQDMLTLARRGVQTRKVVNLNTLIMDCHNMPEFERFLLWTPRIRIKTDLDADLLRIMGSPVHLGKTLINLVSNAVEAMPNGGELTIATRNQYLDRPLQGYDQIRDGDYVLLSVSDTGEGISAQDIKRIFEPFYTKKVMGRSGTGLGLAVVWGTVKDHNGYINVQSEEGKGSTFTLYFPVTREEASPEPVSAPLCEYLGKGESILVVDDVEGQRELAASILKRLNYRVASVASGKEALAYLQDHPVDLVVLDMIMDPGMDGLETYQKIVEIRPGQKAVIVSGFSETDRVNQAQELGAGAYVRKPYMVERLGSAIKKELEKN
jgi:PAS domain S-box-containing protein